MTDEILFIPDGLEDWIEIADVSKAATITGENSYIPISAFDLGVLSNVEIFAILVNVVESKATWRFGGSITRLFPFQPNVDTTPVGRASTQEYPLFINRAQVFRFPEMSPLSFRFYYSPPKWFKDVRIRVWEFVGETYNPRQEQLNRIELNTQTP